MKLFTFDPNKHGLARWLGDGIQCIVMDRVWEENRPVTVRAVCRTLPPRWTYNTVATTMQRLADSGLLRVTKQKHGYHLREFAPAMSRQDWEQRQVNAIIDSLSLHDAVAVGDDGWGHGGWE